MSRTTFSLIFLAGGQGSRLPLELPKQFFPLNGKPIARYSFDLFLEFPFQEYVVVCAQEFQEIFHNSSKEILYASPGQERMFSLMHGLLALKKPVDFILAHDAARPFLDKTDLTKLLEERFSVQAAALATPMTSTIKRTNAQQRVIETLPRESLWEIQTPQLIHRSLLEEGLKQILQENSVVTDEMCIAEKMGYPVKLLSGNPLNFKITTMKDLLLAQTLTQTPAFL